LTLEIEILPRIDDLGHRCSHCITARYDYYLKRHPTQQLIFLRFPQVHLHERCSLFQGKKKEQKIKYAYIFFYQKKGKNNMRCVFFFNQEISFLRSSFVNYQQAVHNAALQDSKNRTHHFHWYFN